MMAPDKQVFVHTTYYKGTLLLEQLQKSMANMATLLELKAVRECLRAPEDGEERKDQKEDLLVLSLQNMRMPFSPLYCQHLVTVNYKVFNSFDV